jgi:hypothetical protein
MHILIIEKDVGLIRRQKMLLGRASHKKCGIQGYSEYLALLDRGTDPLPV